MVSQTSPQQPGIHSIQTRLDDFLEGIPSFHEVLTSHLSQEPDSPSLSGLRALHLSADNVIELRHPYCPYCKRKLVKWGTNPRTIISEDGFFSTIRRVQRYRCRKHKEITPDLSAWVPTGATYTESFRRLACTLFASGFTPARIHIIFRICFPQWPSESLIRLWIRELGDAIKPIMDATPVPTSGYMGYDEIHVNVNGEHGYVQTMPDLETGFWIYVAYTDTLTKATIKQFFSKVKQRNSTDIHGLVRDWCIQFGNLFRTRGYTRITVQRCQAHFKKNLNERIYDAAGLGKAFSRTLSTPFRKVKDYLFAPFDAPTRVQAEIRLAIADYKLRGRISEDVDKILDYFHARQDQVFAHYQVPRLKATNNMAERMNFALETYRSLKHRMKTPGGIEAVILAEFFFHNYRQFPRYIRRMEAKIRRLADLRRHSPGDKQLLYAERGAKVHLAAVRRWYGEYAEIAEDYLVKTKP